MTAAAVGSRFEVARNAKSGGLPGLFGRAVASDVEDPRAEASLPTAKGEGSTQQPLHIRHESLNA